MAFASGARVQLTYVPEVTPGTTPTTPTMVVQRFTSADINPRKGALESQEVRADRQTVSYRHGMRSVEGTIGGELALQAHDDFIEAALGGAWANTVTNATDIGVTNPDQVVRATGSFLTEGFRPGDVVALSGLAVGGDDGNYLVTAVTALAMTLVNLDGSTIGITTEAAGAGPGVDLVGDRVEIGTTKAFFTMERGFLDIAQYEVFRGVTINSMAVDVQPENVPTISYGVLGLDFDEATGTPLDGTPTAAPSNEAMSPFEGGIYENGTLIAILTGIAFTLENGRTSQGAIGQNSAVDIAEGDAKVTGQVSALFTDAALYNKFVNETESSLWLRLVDPADNAEFINVVIPRIKYTGASKSPPKTGDIVMDMPFMGLRHATTGTTLSIQRSNS